MTTSSSIVTDTTNLHPIKDQLNSGEKPLVNDDWDTDTQQWGDWVGIWRAYVKGDQRLEITDKVANLMHITKEQAERFCLNYCRMVVGKLANRLTVRRITGSTPESTAWSEAFLKEARFDGLQKDIHKSALGDGDSFIMVNAEKLETENYPGLIKESAYNGYVGVIPVYDETKRDLVAVVKIWDSPDVENGKRVNIYYDDRIEYYSMADGGGELELYAEPKEWVNSSGEPLGVPFFQFKNDSQDGEENGQSLIKPIISVQDALNSNTLDIVAASGLTAIAPIYTVGLKKIEGDVTIGGAYHFNEDGTMKELHAPMLGRFPSGDVDKLVTSSEFYVSQIGIITDTPLPTSVSGESGEAKKQISEGQVSNAKELQVTWGNVYENMMDYANMITRELGTGDAPPESDAWNTVWEDAEVRSDTDVINNIKNVAEFLDHRTIIEELAKTKTFSHWDKERIEQIIERRMAETNMVVNPPVPTAPATPPNPLGNLDEILAAAVAG